MPQRKRYSAEFKFRVALEAAKSTKTINELSSQFHYLWHPVPGITARVPLTTACDTSCVGSQRY